MKFVRNLQYFAKKKYLIKIYGIIALALVLMITLVMWTSYFSIEKNIKQMEYESSLESLERIEANIHFVLESNDHVTYSAFQNNNVQYLASTLNEYNFDIITRINDLSAMYSAANPSVHSIYIYNGNRNEYYSTNNGIYNIDKDFLKLVEQKAISKNNPPLVRNIGNERVMTYCIVDEDYRNPATSSVVYVNIRLKWLLKQFDSISALTYDYENLFIAFDSQNNCVSNDNVNEDMALLAQEIEKNGVQKKFMIDKIQYNKKDYTATVLMIPEIGWKIVRLNPYDRLYKNLKDMRVLLMLINLTMGVLAVILSALIAKKLYLPVNKLMGIIDDSEKTLYQSANEFEFLENYYRISHEKLYRLKSDIDAKTRIVREYMLKKLLLDNQIFTQEELETIQKDYHIEVNLKEELGLILIQIDDFNTLRNTYNNPQDQPIVLYGMMNIVKELFSYEYAVECINMENNEIAILYNISRDVRKTPLEIISEYENIVKKIFNLTFSASIQDEPVQYQCLPEYYQQLQDKLNWRFMLGKNCRIHNYETIPNNELLHYDFAQEIPLLKALETNHVTAIQKEASKLISNIKRMDYQSAIIATAHLTNSIQQKVFEMNKNHAEPIPIKDIIIKLNNLSQITLFEYEEILCDFAHTFQKYKGTEDTCRKFIGEGVKKYIDEMYWEFDLGAAAIGEALGISAAYAGKVFREYSGMSIPEYINQVRLKQATEWMKNSGLTLIEIMQRVGYRNERNFYKVFKEMYGMTPRSYIKTLNL